MVMGIVMGTLLPLAPLCPLPRLRGRVREGAPLAHAQVASPSPPSPARGGGGPTTVLAAKAFNGD